MNDEQSKALQLLSERASVDPSGLASTEGIHKHILGELFRRGHINKPRHGQVALLRAGAAQVLALQLDKAPEDVPDEEANKLRPPTEARRQSNSIHLRKKGALRDARD